MKVSLPVRLAGFEWAHRAYSPLSQRPIQGGGLSGEECSFQGCSHILEGGIAVASPLRFAGVGGPSCGFHSPPMQVLASAHFTDEQCEAQRARSCPAWEWRAGACRAGWGSGVWVRWAGWPAAACG